MSVIIKCFESDNVVVECRWNSYAPSYQVITSDVVDGYLRNPKSLPYATKEQAVKAFKRKVAKLEGR